MQEKKISLLAGAILAFLLILPVVMAGEDVLTFDKAQPYVIGNNGISRAKLIGINWDALNDGHSSRIRLRLFDDAELVLVRDRLDSFQPQGYVWVGHVDDAPNNTATLSVFDHTLVGTIVINGSEQYTIANDGPGQIMRQMEPGSQKEVEEEDTVQMPRISTTAQTDGDYCEDGSRVDLLVAYTKTVRQKLGGTDATKAYINQRISNLNTANANSGLKFRFRLVHTMETDYPESCDAALILPQLRQTNDGVLDHVAAARDAYKADIVSLIISEAQYGTPCGIAYVMNERSTRFAEYAYNVAALDYQGDYLTCSSYTLAHEIGHNLGNQHDRQASESPPLLPYAYGYQSPKQMFRTLMSYNCPDGCPRFNYWSNPDVRLFGEPVGVVHKTGDSQSADNSRAMEELVLHVANFRENCSAAIKPTPTSTPLPGSQPTATPPASSFPYAHKSYAPITIKN